MPKTQTYTRPPHVAASKNEIRTAILPRSLAAIESRVDGESPMVIAGYGAVYYDPADPTTEYRIMPDFVERFRRGCFDTFLESKRDCYCAPYHDERRVLGRRSRLMNLTSDTRGLRYSVPHDPDDPDHTAIAAKIRRGDVSGSSIDFAAVAEEWRRDPETDAVIREVIEAEVFHLGPVVGEAYSGTTAEIRTDQRSGCDGWQLLLDRKAAFEAAETAGHDALLIEIDCLLLD